MSSLLVVLPSLGTLAKSQSALKGDDSPFKGARRVGGDGSSHSSSTWLRESATVRSVVGEHGVRDGLVVSMQKNQLKVWTPTLGMFVVDANAVEPSSQTLQWDRQRALETTPAPGSLVNIRRPDDKSAWFARLDESLEGKGDGETVKVSKGTLGRRAQVFEIERAHILGPHIPTKVKSESGEFVKDATSRRSAATSRLQEALAPAARWRGVPAAQWVGSLKRGRQERIFRDEEAWFAKHQDDVVKIAVSQALRCGVKDADVVEDMVSEAFYGALSGLRLWAKRPAKQRAMMQRKLAQSHTPAQIEAMDDSELQTRRALMRAFAKARAAIIAPANRPSGEQMDDLDALPASLQGAEFWDGDDESDSVLHAPVAHFSQEESAFSEPKPASELPTSYTQTARLIGGEIADAANLTVAARYLLEQALAQRWPLQNGALPSPETEAVARVLREQFGAAHATTEAIPGMWLFVRNRLREAVERDPLLRARLEGEEVLEKSYGKKKKHNSLLGRQRQGGQGSSHEKSVWTAKIDASENLVPSTYPKPRTDLEPDMQIAVDAFHELLIRERLQAPNGYLWKVRMNQFLVLFCDKPKNREGEKQQKKGESGLPKGVTSENAWLEASQGRISLAQIDDKILARIPPMKRIAEVFTDPDFIVRQSDASAKQVEQQGLPRTLFVRLFQGINSQTWVGVEVTRNSQDELELRPVSYHEKNINPGFAADYDVQYEHLRLKGKWGQKYAPR